MNRSELPNLIKFETVCKLYGFAVMAGYSSLDEFIEEQLVPLYNAKLNFEYDSGIRLKAEDIARMLAKIEEIARMFRPTYNQTIRRMFYEISERSKHCHD